MSKLFFGTTYDGQAKYLSLNKRRKIEKKSFHFVVKVFHMNEIDTIMIFKLCSANQLKFISFNCYMKISRDCFELTLGKYLVKNSIFGK